MKRARIFHEGCEQWAQVVEDDTALRLRDGRHLAVDAAQFMAPARPGAALYALGLNYADHSAELGFTPPKEPLIFIKGYNTLVGHRGSTARPADVSQMHPECELVVVIGAPAYKVSAVDALRYVGGYTIACDYAFRDYLENYYRPNLRVKNRDASTPLGPWIVDAGDIADPQALSLSTTVDGALVQSGSTKDMVFTIAQLIEYLSAFITLSPGDMILTGTPTGVRFVEPGQDVVCDIQGVGRLSNRIRDGAAP